MSTSRPNPSSPPATSTPPSPLPVGSGLQHLPMNSPLTTSPQALRQQQANKLIEGFHKGPPDNLELLEKMFEKAHVDGKSSVMPGVDVHEDMVDLNEEEDIAPTPSLVSRMTGAKRGASRIASSPKKNKKNHVQKDFKRWVDHCISEDRSMTSSSNVTVANDIEAIMEQVVQCGAPEGNDEYYIATKLFGKLENRCFFYTMKTSEERLNWLKRQFEDRRRQ